MKLVNNELKSEYRNGSLDCLSDMTQERVELFFFTHGVLENQIQGISRTFIHRFKDFRGLENQKTKFQDFQKLSRTSMRPG